MEFKQCKANELSHSAPCKKILGEVYLQFMPSLGNVSKCYLDYWMFPPWSRGVGVGVWVPVRTCTLIGATHVVFFKQLPKVLSVHAFVSCLCILAYTVIHKTVGYSCWSWCL